MRKFLHGHAILLGILVFVDLWLKLELTLPCAQLPKFLFFSPFLKNFHKYVPRGMFSKSGPLARRHRWWRRAYKFWRQRVWCLGWGHVGDMDADLAGITASRLLAPSLAPWLLAPFSAPRSMAPRWCFNPVSNLPARAFFLFFLLLSGFFSLPTLPYLTNQHIGP